MSKIRLKKPTIIYFYGIPGSGKSLLSHKISETFDMAVISAERLRFELFEEPRHDKTEMQIINQLMNYMAEEFLHNGMSVILDVSSNRISERKEVKELARRLHAQELMIWIQVDPETAWSRTRNRDRRKAEDKYASNLTKEQYSNYLKIMQNPVNEPCLVLSGKHQFNTHKNIIMKKMLDLGMVSLDDVEKKIARPELINLVSRAQAQAGRVDLSRRNVSIN
jgi:predicted kinase